MLETMMKLGAQLLLLMSVLFAAAAGGYWVRGQDAEAEIARIRSEIETEHAKQARAREAQFAQLLKAERQARVDIEEALDGTRKELDAARELADRNRRNNRLLSDQIAGLLDQLRRHPTGSPTAPGGEAEALSAGIHELFAVVEGAAADLAAEADEARFAGLACERSYQAVSRIRLGGSP